MEGVCSHKPKSIKAPCSGRIEQSSGEKLDKINAFDFLMCFELGPRAQLVFSWELHSAVCRERALEPGTISGVVKWIPAGGCHPGLSKTSFLCRWERDQPGAAPKTMGPVLLEAKRPRLWGEVLLQFVRAE